MSEDKKNENDKARLIAILKSHGIEMSIGGCGCCGSPWMTFKYNGETIFDDDDAGFDTDVTPNAALTGAAKDD